MVMRFLIGSLLLLLSASGLDAAPAVLDFSRSHTIEDVRRSGMKIKLLTGYKGSHLAYVFQEETDVIVLLPGGRKISQKNYDSAYRRSGWDFDAYSVARRRHATGPGLSGGWQVLRQL